MNRYVRSVWLTWLSSDKQIITAVSLICLYMYVISPLRECGAVFGDEPLQFLEPFLTMLCNGFCMPVVILAFLISIIDYPDTSGNVTFILSRIGRTRWYFGQVLFLSAAIVTFLAVLFVFPLPFTGMQSYLLNGWSNISLNLQDDFYLDLRTQYPLACIDLSVINHFRPYEALWVSLLFTFLNLLLHGQIQMYLSLRFQRTVGVVGSVLVLGFGLVTWASQTPARWLLPFSHGTVGWHYDKLFQITEMPVSLSLGYLIAGNVLIFALSTYTLRKKQLWLGGNDHDTN